MSEVLQVNGLCVRWPSFALREVSFRLAEGECLAVLGESGSGKTTLARALACVPGPGAQVEGQVVLAGQELLAMPEAKRRALRMEQFSICFQNSAGWLNPSATLYAQLAEVLARRWPKKEQPARAAALMERVGLAAGDLARLPRELSGGMAQKFMLAMALALSPRLVILDEPTSALDVAAREELVALVRAQAQKGTAFVVVTHDVAVARALCARTLVLYGGRVVEEGPTEQVVARALHPYARGLMRSFAELHPCRDLWGIRPLPEGVQPPQGGCPFYGRCTQSLPACAAGAPALAQAGPGRRVACHRGGVVQALAARGVGKRYGSQTVLRGVDVEVDAGEVVAVVGRSGVGKTTLCGILSGFLPPDEGQVTFGGAPADFARLQKSVGGVQLVCQDSAAALDPRFTVERAVAEPGWLAGLWPGGQGRAGAVQSALRLVGLPVDEGFLARPTGSLSGGQQQRVALARALTMRPALLVADEPTAQLDASSKANVLRMLKGLQNSQGCAMLVVTHDIEAARKIADRIYLLKDAKAAQVSAWGLEEQFRKGE